MNNAKDTLPKALTILSQPGVHGYGSLIREEGDTRCFCLLGAIAVAEGYEIVPPIGDTHPTFKGIDENYSQLNDSPAVIELSKYINMLNQRTHGARNPVDTIYIFNDSNVLKGNAAMVRDTVQQCINSLDN